MSAPMTLSVRQESWPVRGVFRIARGSRTEVSAVVVELRQDDYCGRGESSPTAHYGESLTGVVEQINAVAQHDLADGLNRDALQQALPPGAARNALDCALWDLAAKQAGRPVWTLAGFASAPQPVTTAFTLSIDEPEAMAEAAAQNANRPLLKLKLAGDGKDRARVEAVHGNAPAARLIVDANEAWSVSDYETLVPAFQGLGVAMIEQPFKADQDAVLEQLARPIPVCADESCHTRSELGRLRPRYDMVNIKLDKTGGLSEALALREQALRDGFEIMVGCMVGTSLAMAPAHLVAQGARFVDLDGPLLLARDRDPGLVIDGSLILPPEPALWG